MFRATARAIQTLLDIILPRKERVVRLETYRIEDIPLSPRTHSACGVEITTLMQYRVPPVEDIIKALKYDRAGVAATLLAGMLAEYLREEIANIRLFSTHPIVLVPVPLHTTRERERGFNQVIRILGSLPPGFKDGTHSSIASHAIIRTRATPQQTRLSRTERLRNVDCAFALNGSAANDTAVRGAHVILIDDVTTTGATLAAAGTPFIGVAASITLLALAHA